MTDGTEVPVRCLTCGDLVGFTFLVGGKPQCTGFIECCECVKRRDAERNVAPSVCKTSEQ